MLLNNESRVILNIERAANDLRKGFPVAIHDGKDLILAASPETISKELLENFTQNNKVFLTLTANRLKYLTNDKTSTNSKIEISDINNIAGLCGLDEKHTQITSAAPSSSLENTALELAKIAELIPSIITTNYNQVDSAILTIEANDINSYADLISLNLQKSCETTIALRGAENCRIIAFRPNIGGKEHYAIIVSNQNSQTPIVRVHSSCYTGDLLDSLACDCHDQLHSAIELMSEQGGGIILYMLQEGRGIGLINKLRAYALKEQGMDTVEANENLGFDDDARLFEPAAQMLKQMNIKRIKLLTNNPRKAKGMENCDIEVESCIPHIMQANIHNKEYLNTKSSKMGHNFGEE